jgi:hypothetical protein
MKKRNLIAVAAAALLLAACIPSVNSFYTEKDVAFDPRLLGAWQEKDNTNNPDVWKFEKSGDNAFKLTVFEKGKTGEFNAHLFKVNQERFLDLIPNDCKYADNQSWFVACAMFPGHLLVRVRQIEPGLQFSPCNYEWLDGYLKTNRTALAHHAEADSIVLTADTRDLQNFVMKHLGTNELFKEVGELVRQTNSIQSANGG